MTFIPREYFYEGDEVENLEVIMVHKGSFTKGHKFVVTNSYDKGRKVHLVDKEGNSAYGIDSRILRRI